MDTREIVMPTGGSSDGLLGGGGIGALLIGALLFGGGLGGLGMGNRGYGVGTPAAAAVATDVVLNPAFQSLQQQIQTLQGQVSNNGIHSEINEVERSIEAANTANLQGIAANALIYSNGNAALQTALASGNFTTLSSINGLGRDLTASATQALINNLQNFNSLQNSQQTATNQIIAGQNAQNANFANCCCEIKQLIQADGNATRALINDLNVQNLRDQLGAANGKVSNNEQNQFLLQSILSHLHPQAIV